MTPLNSGNVIRLPLDAVIVKDRLREVREAQVANLIAMAEDTGITTPIHVRKVKGTYVLIDGAHRLTAARRMGLIDIAALVVECRDDQARAMELSNNLGSARMTMLQTAVFAASWKKAFYEVHPERRPGVFKGNQYSGKVVSAADALTNAMSDALGRKPRQIFNIIAAAERLTEAEIKILDRAEVVVSLEDIIAIGKIGEPDERLRVVSILAAGNAKSVRAARQQIATEAGVEAPVKDPVEAEFQALSAAWRRASMAVRRRFFHEFSDDIAAMEGGTE